MKVVVCFIIRGRHTRRTTTATCNSEEENSGHKPQTRPLLHISHL